MAIINPRAQNNAAVAHLMELPPLFHSSGGPFISIHSHPRRKPVSQFVCPPSQFLSPEIRPSQSSSATHYSSWLLQTHSQTEPILMPTPEGDRHLVPAAQRRLVLSCVLLLLSAVCGAQESAANGASAAADPASTSSFVLADPNTGAAQSAYSPPAEPSPVVPAHSIPSGTVASTAAGGQELYPQTGERQRQTSTGAGSGGYGTLMPGGAAAGEPTLLNESPQTQDSAPNSAKRRQFSQYPAAPEALVPGVGLAPGGPTGTCPGGASLPIECDPKRPWPQCPPQSYCYATNTVDIGPYFCCPVWSTYGAAWRPATPFYNYAPPPPPNWPEPMRMASAPWSGGPVAAVRKGRKEQRFDDNGQALMTSEEQRKILQVMNDWVERQKDDEGKEEGTTSSTTTAPEHKAETGSRTD